MNLLLLPPVGWVAALVWGALWGSFFNVCIYRVPLEKSIAWPGSRCPHCDKDIAGYDNIPILSWLLLRGRCRNCREPISPRYLLIEALTAALTVLLYHRFVVQGRGPLSADLAHFIVYFFFTGTLIVLSGIDFDHTILPDTITKPGIVIFFALGRLLGDVSTIEAFVGLCAGYGFVWVIVEVYYRLFQREGMGLGDGKLLALTCGLLGIRSLPITLLIGSTTGLLVSVPVLLLRRRREAKAAAEPEVSLRHQEVPFGPFLAAGAFVYMYLFAGRDFEDQLLRLFGYSIS